MKIRLQLLCILLPLSLAAQNTTGTLKVSVLDNDSSHILGANIKVLIDNQFIKGNATDPFGLGTISNLTPGCYRLEISFIGYQKHITEIKVDQKSITTIVAYLKPAKHEFPCYTFSCGYWESMLEPYGGIKPIKTEKILKIPAR
ncbi:MAG: carboxypeptidase-like regulatory domain-containing protein [Bacteroidia bacterium]